MHEPLTDEEFEALDDLLLETRGLDQAMDLCMLDGFVAALACAPARHSPETWIRWVWDCQDGRGRPDFANEAESRHLFSLILRHAADVALTLQHQPDIYEPILMEGEAAPELALVPATTMGDADAVGVTAAGGIDADANQTLDRAEAQALADGPVLVIDEWCAGFLRGLALDQQAWQALEAAQPAWLSTIRLYGVAESLEQLHQMRLPLVEHQQAALGLAQTVRDIHHWFGPARGPLDAQELRGAVLPDTPVRRQSKVGRNDPCPCGSGKKYKQCGCAA